MGSFLSPCRISVKHLWCACLCGCVAMCVCVCVISLISFRLYRNQKKPKIDHNSENNINNPQIRRWNAIVCRSTLTTSIQFCGQCTHVVHTRSERSAIDIILIFFFIVRVANRASEWMQSLVHRWILLFHFQHDKQSNGDRLVVKWKRKRESKKKTIDSNLKIKLVQAIL